ncbi:MAG: response regulator transcription factor [Chloroflexi bacterium]|nr:response regulator transcription factor [Chloroflexota bacterium]
MVQTIKVLLVDDHLMIREGVRTMLAGEQDIAVVGEAATGAEALQKVGELEPHVVLMDIRMPGMSGTEAAKRIKDSWPTTSVIMLTMYDSDMYVVEALQAGAAGYLTKDASRELLCHAVRSVVDGGTMVRSGLLRHAIEGLLHTSADKAQGSDVPFVEHLTPREMDVLRLLAKGYSNKEICSELQLAEVTVKKYVQTIIQKLGVSDRTHAAIRAARLGIVE